MTPPIDISSEGRLINRTAANATIAAGSLYIYVGWSLATAGGGYHTSARPRSGLVPPVLARS
jgi:hypothetical protein